MQKRSLQEIEKLDYVGSGTFGRVFKSDNLKFKIFKGRIKIDSDWFANNPALKRFRLRNFLLIKRNPKIKHTDLIFDTISIDNKFIGTVSKYQDGITLSSAKDELNFDDKVSISNELSRNAKELTDNRIYPLDYKLNNVLYDENKNSGNKVHIIDLDDTTTKTTLIPNFVLKRRSIHTLNSTIISLFSPRRPILTDEIYTSVEEIKAEEKRKTHANSYDDINDFISKRSKPHTFFFIKDKDVNEDSIADIKRRKEFSDFKLVLLVTDNKNDLTSIYHSLKNSGLSVFDIILINDMEDMYRYMNNFNSVSYLLYDSGVVSLSIGNFNLKIKRL